MMNMPSFSLAGKVAIVAGGRSGMGRGLLPWVLLKLEPMWLFVTWRKERLSCGLWPKK